MLYGPHVENVAAFADALDASGGGFRVADEAGLAARLYALLDDAELRARAGGAARATVGSVGSVEASVRTALDCLA